jgi:hypothetical protein
MLVLVLELHRVTCHDLEHFNIHRTERNLITQLHQRLAKFTCEQKKQKRLVRAQLIIVLNHHLMNANIMFIFRV